MRLGPATEQAVQTHLHTLDTALEKTADKTLGLCDICHDYVEADLLYVDYTSCVCLSHLSEEEQRKLEWELELSQAVQKALLPQQLPMIPGVELAVFSRPAQIVSGDYFDFFQFQDGTPGLVIADVAGHGVSASMLMASLQTALRTLSPIHHSPLDVVRQINHFFRHNVHLTTFVTLFLARYEPDSRRLIYANAGHNPPLLFSRQAGGTIAWLAPTGAAIGLIEDLEITTETVTLAPGDTLLLYTDGVTEMINAQRQEFGSERLAALVGQNTNLPAREIIQTLRHSLHEFGNGRAFADDTTIIAWKVGP
jgi:sigma-B regulation protein RsbU (phosphoserine phosphatase)